MGAFLTGVCKVEESFVDFANEFSMSSCVSCRVVNVVDAGPVFQNLGKFCDLIAIASLAPRKGAEISFIKFLVLVGKTYNSMASVSASPLVLFFL